MARENCPFCGHEGMSESEPCVECGGRSDPTGPGRRRFGWLVLPVLAGLVALSIAGLLAYDAGRAQGMREERAAIRQGRQTQAEPVQPLQGASSSADGTVVASASSPTRVVQAAGGGVQSGGVVSASPGTVTTPAEPEPEPASTRITADCVRYAAQIDTHLSRWNALVQSLSGATSVTRDRTIAQLRAIEDEVAGIPAPACAAGARDELVASMAAMIEALWRTPTGEDPTGTGAFAGARDQLSRAQREIAALRTRG